jgi:cytochrome c-type biogenesis protein CcmH/NrfG
MLRPATQNLCSPWTLALGLLLAVALPSFALDRTAAERALLEGRADDAIAALRSHIAGSPHDAAAHLLLCRAFFSEEFIGPAVTACEAAIANGGATDSNTQLWMGRAYGRRADQVGPFTGFSLARKARSAFERAHTLDPASVAAANDLSEYYIAAPSIVGGGTDKALALASSVEPVMPFASHRMRAMVAEKKHEFPTAEREFRAAAESSGRPESWTDLGNYFARRGNPDRAVAALRQAYAADTAKDAALVDIASILNDVHRNPELAQQALRDYLASSAKTDAAPAFRAHLLLGQILAASGDKDAAKIEFQAALKLASNYAPARKALQSLQER